jgi:hypothetical protein
LTWHETIRRQPGWVTRSAREIEAGDKLEMSKGY